MKRKVLILLVLFTLAYPQETDTFLQIFGDVRVSYPSEKRKLEFILGDTDLLGFIVHGNLKALVEILIEQPESDLDVERGYVEVRYRFLSFRVGKFHSPLGYFNRRWHHGLYLMTPVDRPQIVNFEDEGGPLPVHTVGVDVSVEGKVYGKVVGFSGSLGNGNLQLGSTNTSDLDSKKIFLGKVYIRWDPFSEAGLSFGYDPMEVSDPDIGYVRTENLILGLHLAYRKPGSLDLNGELYVLREEVSNSYGSGGFLIVSYPILRREPFGEIRPYGMIDFLNWEEGNLWFESVRRKLIAQGEEEVLSLSRRVRYTLGVKLTPSAFFSGKLEFFYEDHRDRENVWTVRAVLGFGIPVVR